MPAKPEITWQEILRVVESCREDFRSIHEPAHPTIALFGAGATGQEALRYFQARNVRISCFIDNSQEKQGTEIQGIPVVSMNHPLAASPLMTVIASKTAVNSIRQQLREQGRRCITFDSVFVIDHLERFVKIRNDLLADDISVRTLDGILLTMLTGSNKYCEEIMDPNQYFCLPQFLNTDDCFVDAGAFVGDTAEKFIWANFGMFQHLHLFEPGFKQLKALQCRMKRLTDEWAIDPDKISILNAGLSDKNGQTVFSHNADKPAASTFKPDQGISNESPQTIQVIRLDSYLENVKIPVTFIKSDIEGMEIQMLRGAENTIRHRKPKLAISAYHRSGDIIDIIDLINSFVPEYRVALRHHSPNLSETVLYFWNDPES